MTCPQSSFSDQLRQAICDSGHNQAVLSRATGVQAAVLSRFIHRRAGMSMQSIEKVVAHLGLELCALSKEER